MRFYICIGEKGLEFEDENIMGSEKGWIYQHESHHKETETTIELIEEFSNNYFVPAMYLKEDFVEITEAEYSVIADVATEGLDASDFIEAVTKIALHRRDAGIRVSDFGKNEEVE